MNPSSDTTTEPRASLLLAEDDRDLAQEIEAELASRGFALCHEDNGTAVLERLRTQKFDLLILDRMLPGIDGLTILETIRAENRKMPVLVLSALSAVDERIRGLKAGGDDYLTKPCALGELAARVEALLRRPAENRETSLQVGPLVIDLIERSATRGKREIELLPREFKLLEYMMRRAGQVVTRDMLFEDVWHYRFVPPTNLVDVHMGRLRRKIDEPGEFPLIQSIRAVGFTLRAPE